MDRARYFDNAATTPVDPRVVREMLPYLEESWGNASSIHAWGAKAAAGVDLARERVSQLLGADDPSQVVFTSGATESDNWVLRGFDKVSVSPFEHSAVLEPAIKLGHNILRNRNVELFLPSQRQDLISVMSVNNETGTLWEPARFRPSADRVHSDITQQLGKLPTEITALDFASFSAHKLYGPKGVGGLYCADEPPPPLMLGGEQELGFRAGTLNVPGIVGLGAAAAIAIDELEQNRAHATELRAIFLEHLSSLSDFLVNGGEETSPYILSVSILGVEGETLVIELDREGFAVSAGAACSSRSSEPSHVLMALGLEERWLRGTVRISFGKFNSVDATRQLAMSTLQIVQRLRKLNSSTGSAT